ncbi:hypothetical protein Sjap_021832 [Stephania japonica]|uniref:At3g05675-like ankyrin-like domain-containing protein n=1 Tax=Stephania japonica TaxID=461633 RepID=A0AAP0EQB6_9MAGN
MAESGDRKSQSHRETPGLRRALCCSFGISPKSPEIPPKTPQKSVPNSPSNIKRVSRIDPRRILSPGRVSPIDSDTHFGPSTAAEASLTEPEMVVMMEELKEEEEIKNCNGVYDVRLSLKGKNGECVVLEMDSEVLVENSCVFAKLVSDCRESSSGCSADLCRIEVPDVEKLSVYVETIELMFEGDPMRRLVKIGVSRAIDVLQVWNVKMEAYLDGHDLWEAAEQEYENKWGAYGEDLQSTRRRKNCGIVIVKFSSEASLMRWMRHHLSKARLEEVGSSTHVGVKVVGFLSNSNNNEIIAVAASIMFTKGVSSCLKYLEAVPWTEGEEERLKKLFETYKFDETTKGDVLSRLYSEEQINSQEHMAMQLVCSVTNGTDGNARTELKSFVMSLLSKSSIYQKNLPDLNKEDLYVVCQSCLGSLVKLFEEASEPTSPQRKLTRPKTAKPLIERISRQVDNVNWLLDILLEQQLAEHFVDVWANESDLLRMHKTVSPMVRYEISRISAAVFVALGRGKLQCPTETRCRFVEAWFEPMIADFGWLRRCKKGLDIKLLEDAIGQLLLTLPMKLQQQLFMEWLFSYSKQGREFPNLAKAFQTWGRRSIFRSHGRDASDSR